MENYVREFFDRFLIFFLKNMDLAQNDNFMEIAVSSKNKILIKFLWGFMAIWSLRKFYIPILLLRNEHLKKKIRVLSSFWKKIIFSIQPRPGHGTHMKIITNFKIKASTHNLWNPFNFPIKLWLLRVSKHKKIEFRSL